MSKTIYSKVRRPGRGYKFREHTVQELVDMLKSFPQNARVLFFNLNDRSSYCPLVALTAARLSPELPDSESDSTMCGPFRELKTGQVNTVFISALVGERPVDTDTSSRENSVITTNRK